MLNFLLDLFFPKRCVGCNKFGSFICAKCFALISFDTVSICPVCNKGSIDGAVHPFCKTPYCLDGLLSAVVYSGVIRKLIYQFKYKPYAFSIKNILTKLFYEALLQNEVFFNLQKQALVITPVPLHAVKERKRGYNHAALIAQGLSSKFKLEFLDKVILRTKDTKPQYKLKKEERIKNIQGAFVLNKKMKSQIKGKNILLIDDLATTCATLNECAKVLKRNGAKSVWGVTFARED